MYVIYRMCEQNSIRHRNINVSFNVCVFCQNFSHTARSHALHFMGRADKKKPIDLRFIDTQPVRFKQQLLLSMNVWNQSELEPLCPHRHGMYNMLWFHHIINMFLVFHSIIMCPIPSPTIQFTSPNYFVFYHLNSTYAFTIHSTTKPWWAYAVWWPNTYLCSTLGGNTILLT